MEPVLLVPHDGAPFKHTLLFTSLEKAKNHWLFLKNRDCVEIRKLEFNEEIDCWMYI